VKQKIDIGKSRWEGGENFIKKNMLKQTDTRKA
jgi:hypothetical protein